MWRLLIRDFTGLHTPYVGTMKIFPPSSSRSMLALGMHLSIGKHTLFHPLLFGQITPSLYRFPILAVALIQTKAEVCKLLCPCSRCRFVLGRDRSSIWRMPRWLASPLYTLVKHAGHVIHTCIEFNVTQSIRNIYSLYLFTCPG